MPIGSYYVKGMPGHVDLTAVNAFDPAGAQALLKEAGVALPLQLTIKLPPTPYARGGDEIVAARLAKVGITAKLENIEWAQWLSGVCDLKAYDLTLIAHVDPLDLGNFARPGYCWNHSSPAFNELGRASTLRPAPSCSPSCLARRSAWWPRTRCAPTSTSRRGSRFRTHERRGL